MANKRQLKRNVNYVCADLFAQALAAQLYGSKEKECDDSMLSSILNVHNDFIRRISHPEPGMKPKNYYKAFRQDFKEQINELIDQINALF